MSGIPGLSGSARFEATFAPDGTSTTDGDHAITGTIDNFVGADGMSRDWSVTLKKADVADTGVISRTATNDTVWTIDGTAADASGE